MLRSYKARNWLPSLQHVRVVADQWQRNVDHILQFEPDERTLVLKYEDFTSNPAAGVAALERFLVCAPLKAEVMNQRVNTFASQAESSYVAPQDLSAEEWDAALTLASAVMSRAGYGSE